MRRVLTIALSTLMLAGCATGYDKSAMPVAAATAHEGIDSCKARRAANEIQNWSQLEACELAAARSFFTMLKVKNMDAFETYAVSMQALAVERDANRVTERQVRSRGRDIVFRFLADCACKPSHQILPWDASLLSQEGGGSMLGGGVAWNGPR